MPRLLRFFLIGLAALTVVGLISLAAIYRASQYEPKFYRQALQTPPTIKVEAGEELEKQVLDLHNEARREGMWEAEFTADQVNHWLAVDLPQKFAKLTPKEVSDPRVALTENQIRLACRYENPKFSAVVSLAVEVHLTDEPNVLAFRIRKARAGMVPLPLKDFMKQIKAAAAKADVDVRWVEQGGDPVALVEVPTEINSAKRTQLRIDQVEIGEGSVRLSGRTGSLDAFYEALSSTTPSKTTTQ